jgi:DNA helicase IV|tara:strand:+ start:807 stop:1301 length:495 start_codon:yes stop_codon:yes gene_type:complete
MIQKLTNYASIIGVIGAIGGGFYAWGEFNTRLDAIENKEFVVNETVDLAPINEKISDLEVEILDRMSALEDEWMARDNDTNDDILNDIAGLKSDVEDLFEKASKADSQLQLNIVELSDKTFKEFGKIKDLISELNKLIAIAQKTSELNKILIDEIKAEASNPLG